MLVVFDGVVCLVKNLINIMYCVYYFFIEYIYKIY